MWVFGETGRFELGRSSGTFSRRSYGVQRADPLSKSRQTRAFGHVAFNVSGSDFRGAVSGHCRHLEGDVGTSRLQVTDLPFRYRCRFSRAGQPLDAELLLDAAPLPTGLLLAESRAGEMRMNGRVFHLQAIHHSPAFAVRSGDPLGYRIGNIGAVDVNASPRTIFAPVEGPDREAVLLAGVALSLLWTS